MGSAAGLRVVLTTSTRMRPDPGAHAVHAADELATLPWPARFAPPLVLGNLASDGRKLLAPPAEVLEALTRLPGLELLVIEADGSRGASIKAYRDGEPVLPARGDWNLVVLGVDALEARCGSALVHRGERLAELLGVSLEEPLSAAHVAGALASQPAYLASAWQIPTAVLINKVDDAAALQHARTLCEALVPMLAPTPAAGILWRGQAIEGQVAWAWRQGAPHIPIAVLAAGSGRRFGSLKQVAPYRGRPLLAHALQHALDASTGAVLLVVGHDASQALASVSSQCASPRVQVVHNPHHLEGLSTSLQAALRSAPASAPGVVVALGDMPEVGPGVFAQVVAEAARYPEHIVAPRHEGRRGHPVYLPRALFPHLAQLRGDQGAAPVIAAHGERLRYVDVASGAIHRDIDHRWELEP